MMQTEFSCVAKKCLTFLLFNHLIFYVTFPLIYLDFSNDQNLNMEKLMQEIDVIN